MDLLPLNAVHVDLVHTDDVAAAARRDAYLALMSPDEHERMARLIFERDRRRFLLTRALVRTMLSRYAAVRAADWRFVENVHGRPEILDRPRGVPDLRFNISHTDGLIAIAVTRHGDVGVDVENAGARQAPIDVAGTCFAPAELAALRQEPAASQSRSFFRFWTLKESYIKARGLGLSLPLDQFSFQIQPEGSIRFFTAPASNDPAAHWRFWQFGVAGRHVVALCVRRGAADRPVVQARRLVPLLSEAEQAWDWVATSA
jgi:4'-phosphopantetheinyl transferase